MDDLYTIRNFVSFELFSSFSGLSSFLNSHRMVGAFLCALSYDFAQIACLDTQGRLKKKHFEAGIRSLAAKFCLGLINSCANATGLV